MRRLFVGRRAPDPDDYLSFEANWFDGWRTHFCPDCKDKPEHAAAIAEDGKLTVQLRNVVSSIDEAKRPSREVPYTAADAREKEIHGH